MISFRDSLWYCTASAWPIDVILAKTNSVWLVSFSFGFWLCTSCIFFFSFWLHFEHPSVTHTKRFNSVFFLFSPGTVPMFFFPSLTLTPLPVLLLFSSHLPLRAPLAHPLPHHLSVPFRLQAKAVYLFRQDLFFPSQFASSPPFYLSHRHHLPLSPLLTCLSLWMTVRKKKGGEVLLFWKRAEEICGRLWIWVNNVKKKKDGM